MVADEHTVLSRWLGARYGRKGEALYASGVGEKSALSG